MYTETTNPTLAELARATPEQRRQFAEAAWQRLQQQKRENGSPSAPHFALRRRIHNPTPFETQQELAALFPPNKRKPISQAELNQQTKTAIRYERARRHGEERIQRRIRENRALAAAAKTEWQAFNGRATQEQWDAWHSKYGKIYIRGGTWDWTPASIIPSLPPGPPRKAMGPPPVSKDFGGNPLPQRQVFRRNGSPYRKFQ
jgi:hypothetical protein